MPSGDERCRLLVKVLMRHSRRLPGWALRQAAMPWLDLFMMRKQLLNLRDLAEAQALAGMGAYQTVN